jgi:F0F1-type ATP synthase assembly protein I
MSSKLIWGVLGGVVVGAAFGFIAGNTPIGIAVCIAAGAIAAYIWERMEQRRKLEGK